MKWFKHDTDARRSEKLKPIYREFGFLKGYGICMVILEMIAEKMDETDRCHLEMHINDWAKEVGVKSKVFKTFLEHYENIPGILLKRSDNVIRIEIPNLLKKKDEYSSKSRHVSGENPPASLSLSYSDINTKSSINKRANEGEKNGLRLFEDFWKKYPRHKSKASAIKAWRRIPETEKDLILQKLDTYEFNENPKYIPYPSVWLNQRRWEDEPDPADPKSVGYVGRFENEEF